MIRHPELLLMDILEEIDSILAESDTIEYTDFVTSNAKLKSTKYSLLVIGEACSKFPEEILQKYTKVNWRQIKGLRNRIIHEYFGTNVKVIWKVVKEDIPILKREILIILTNEFPNAIIE